MAYVLIHLGVAIAAVVAARRMIARGYLTDEDGTRIPAETVNFKISIVAHYVVAAYCVGAVLWGALCP